MPRPDFLFGGDSNSQVRHLTWAAAVKLLELARRLASGKPVDAADVMLARDISSDVLARQLEVRRAKARIATRRWRRSTQEKGPRP